VATFYVKSGAGAAEFAQSTAYSLGNKIVPKRSDSGSNYLVGRRWVWECTTAGTSAAAEPTWPAAVTVDVTTVVSGTATFTARRPGHSTSGNENWAFATIYLDYLYSAGAVGDFIYVSNNHAESISTAFLQICANGVHVLCVDDATAPPTALATTATVTVNGANNFNWNGNIPNNETLVYGISFIVGVGDTGTRTFGLNAMFQSCKFELATTGASSRITFGNTSETIDCWFKFAVAGQGVTLSTQTRWTGGGLSAGGASPTHFIYDPNGCELRGMDFSNASAGMNIFYTSNGYPGNTRCNAYGCKMPASWSGALVTYSGIARLAFLEMSYTDASSTAINYRNYANGGTATGETTIVKTGGNMQSQKLVSVAAARLPAIRAMTSEIAAYSSTVGSAITVTVDILRDSLTNLTDKEVVLEVEYLSASGSPLVAMATSVPSIMAAASDLAASTAVWTTTGLTNPNEQKVSVTFTPQVAGMIMGRVKLYKASATVYVDPVLQIS
jgi:hypothetical protein